MVQKYWVWIVTIFVVAGYSKTLLADEDGDILDFLPAIIANVEKKPPPPPEPAQWKVTNLVYCPSNRSEWTVSDGTTSRESLVIGQFIFTSNTSEPVTVEPGERTFTWTLNTELVFTTCGFYSGSFTRVLESGSSYEFILSPNDSGGLGIETVITD